MIKSIDVTFNSAWEFMYALIDAALGDKEVQEEVNQLDNSDKEAYLNYRNNMLNKFSSYMKNEIFYFFGEGNTSCDDIGQLIYIKYLINYPEIDNPLEIIRIIESESCLTIAQNIAKKIYYEITNSDDSNSEIWSEKKQTIEGIIEVIDSLDFQNMKRKNKILEVLRNIEETKQRYLMLLNGFYTKYYKDEEENIKNTLKPYIERYKKQAAIDEAKFISNYTLNNMNSFEGKLKIHICFHKYLGYDFWAIGHEGDNEWIVLYYNAFKYLELNDENYRERILNFLKAVSDKKRLQIIQMLKKRPHYVNEIAENMNMTAPTASYHLTALQEFGIVNFERIDHKFYYEINEKKLKELFEEAQEYFLS